METTLPFETLPRSLRFKGARAFGVGFLLVASSGCAVVSRPMPPISPPASAGSGGVVADRTPSASGVRPVILPEDIAGFSPGWTEEGVASWYGTPFHGRATASGEIYDMQALTAAHQTLPFGTLIDILNLDSGERVQLRVNDRGPFVGNRILDVSRRGAEALAMVGPGTARVRIEILEVPEPTRCWEVQVGSFRETANAERRRAELVREGLPARIETGPDGQLRVRIGPVEERAEAQRLRQRLGGVLLAC